LRKAGELFQWLKNPIVASVKRYLKELAKVGVPVRFGVLFGSHARDPPREWSDMDLRVVSSSYDTSCTREDVNLLWRVAARTDNRMEPVPVGLDRRETDDGSTIVEMARREGIRIDASISPD